MRRLRDTVEYQQAFAEDGQRLCMVCMAPVAACTTPAQVRDSIIISLLASLLHLTSLGWPMLLHVP
jgi:hypothetical protein